MFWPDNEKACSSPYYATIYVDNHITGENEADLDFGNNVKVKIDFTSIGWQSSADWYELIPRVLARIVIDCCISTLCIYTCQVNIFEINTRYKLQSDVVRWLGRNIDARMIIW